VPDTPGCTVTVSCACVVKSDERRLRDNCLLAERRKNSTVFGVFGHSYTYLLEYRYSRQLVLVFLPMLRLEGRSWSIQQRDVQKASEG
jgi:hypothetical protein